METSFQAIPPPPPPAGVLIYPTTVTKRPTSTHSSGSFGPVFAVLAVILVISAAACVFGRLFSKRSSNHPKANHGKQYHGGQKGRSRDPEFEYGFGFGPKGPGDIEFGFEKKNPQMVMANGYGRGHQLPMMESARRFG